MARKSIDCRDHPDDIRSMLSDEAAATASETNRAVVAAREVEP